MKLEQDCLKTCAPRDYIYLPSGRHSIKWLEPLNAGGLIKAISGAENNKIAFDSNVLQSNEKAIFTCEESDNIFLSFNGDYTIENVVIDCQQVRVGIWTKGGTVTLKNCQLIGDRSSSTGIGIAIAGKMPWKMQFRFGIENEFSQFVKTKLNFYRIF